MEWLFLGTEFLGGLLNVLKLIMVVITQLYTIDLYTLKWVNCKICELYLNKTVVKYNNNKGRIDVLFYLWHLTFFTESTVACINFKVDLWEETYTDKDSLSPGNVSHLSLSGTT